jgi:hypothetical protein
LFFFRKRGKRMRKVEGKRKGKDGMQRRMEREREEGEGWSAKENGLGNRTRKGNDGMQKRIEREREDRRGMMGCKGAGRGNT